MHYIHKFHLGVIHHNENIDIKLNDIKQQKIIIL